MTKVSNLLEIDMSKWEFNSQDKTYYQLSIPYVSNPPDPQYNNLSIFIPDKYFKSQKNKDNKTFTCEINQSGKIGKLTSKNAPIVFLVDTGGYMPCEPLKEYESKKDYTDKGLIYIHPGCRGRTHGAPSGIVDLKAAIRFLRKNKNILPGDTEKIFTFGMSGGGAQSAILGSSGNANVFNGYFKKIGAVLNERDDVYGCMCWCPITGLDIGDAGYEWNLGCSRKDLDKEKMEFSKKLSEAYASYVNNLGLCDENGEKLFLEKSKDGVYQNGSYYDYVKSEIERSFSNFIQDTKFPYNYEKSQEDHSKLGEKMKKMGGKKGGNAFEMKDKITRVKIEPEVQIKGTYKNISDYLKALNSKVKWIEYDDKKKKASITSISDYVKAMKPATKGIGAYDDLERNQGENELFGLNNEKAHFDRFLKKIVKNTEYEKEFENDFKINDEMGHNMNLRVDIMTPLYYLIKRFPGYKKSKVAPLWRIRTGLQQGDCALCTEINLALACKNYEEVKNVDFEMIWDQQHREAERKGGVSYVNFIEWVLNNC